MAWGELRERQDFTQPIQRMEEGKRELRMKVRD